MGKRLFDFLTACILLMLTLPLFLLVALVVRIGIGHPVLFRQPRIGLQGRPFIFLKFRTMTNAVNLQQDLLPDEARLVPIGRILRRLSLDELPQLLNVLRGDMSLVGPRPLLPEYLPLYNVQQARRHEVKPGITGWAQVNGRNAVSWEERFRLDVWYIDHRSFWLDLKILLLTIWRVFQAQGVSQPGCATMSRFTGNRRNHG